MELENINKLSRISVKGNNYVNEGFVEPKGILSRQDLEEVDNSKGNN